MEKRGAGCLIVAGGERWLEPARRLAEVLEADGRPAEEILARDGREGHGALLEAWQRWRGPVVAFGPGAWFALALAVQLPVERLVLIDPMAGRPVRRWPERYAAGNLALCSAEALCLGGDPAIVRRLVRQLPAAYAWKATVDAPWTNCEFSVKNAVCAFLDGGVRGKSLAENPEMCIIYR